METAATQVLVVLFVAVAELGALQLPVDATPPITGQQLPSDALPSDLTSSVAANQMLLLRILNESSTTCSLHEAAVAEFNARQTDAQEELRRSLDLVLATLQNKTQAALDEVAEKERQSKEELASFKEAAVRELTETKQRMNYESMSATKEAAPATSQVSTGKRFRIYAETVAQSEAMDACRRKGGRIAVPENAEQNARLQELVNYHSIRFRRDPTRYWIGINDKEKEGKWTNSNTGSTVTYINFNTKQPDNRGGQENCVELIRSWEGWNDNNCASTEQGYLCEFTGSYMMA